MILARIDTFCLEGECSSLIDFSSSEKFVMSTTSLVVYFVCCMRKNDIKQNFIYFTEE